jgi:biofilm PGA synthesis N-glycosyltransferase PgaC
MHASREAFFDAPLIPMISIVIPAYNEEECIGRCLESLANQDTRESYEVILVDNGSTDDTRVFAERFKRRMNLRILTEPRKGRGIARRTGFAAARGEILLSTDADVVVQAGWIDAMTKALRRNGVVGVVGDVQIDDCPEFINQAYNVTRPFIAASFRVLMGYWLLNGGNSGYVRWAYKAAGGFGEYMDAQDDTEFSSRLQRLGRTAFAFESMVTASGRRFREGLLAGAMGYPRAFARRVLWGERRVRLANVR